MSNEIKKKTNAKILVTDDRFALEQELNKLLNDGWEMFPESYIFLHDNKDKFRYSILLSKVE